MKKLILLISTFLSINTTLASDFKPDYEDELLKIEVVQIKSHGIQMQFWLNEEIFELFDKYDHSIGKIRIARDYEKHPGQASMLDLVTEHGYINAYIGKGHELDLIPILQSMAKGENSKKLIIKLNNAHTIITSAYNE